MVDERLETNQTAKGTVAPTKNIVGSEKEEGPRYVYREAKQIIKKQLRPYINVQL